MSRSSIPPAGADARTAARAWTAIAVVVASLAPAAALAYGGHDSVGCTGCHTLAPADGSRGGGAVFAAPPNPKLVEPRTNRPYTGTTAFCLFCHAETDRGGQGYLTVSRHTSHPFGLPSVNRKVARVPPELLREGGRFECLSCHDVHPSNPNYRYLRVDVGKDGEELEKVCVTCHPAKSARGGREVVRFDSMDETRASPSPDRTAVPATEATSAPAPGGAP
ncbi:cytochrome c3 family protein [Anaeromyxobacter oryzisoli]|uniref:cytochrome c3 family protein n=1 Tax=Anaeromyxobacter oryzisoli TaxID=2925408 RepID=UPI001F5842D7|nr:cytochrome c3 family protein [Anaeromyxobacter sp. SG63]